MSLAVLAGAALAIGACAGPTREGGVALNGSYSSYEAAEPDHRLTIHSIIGNDSCTTGHDLRVVENAETVTVELVAHRRSDVRWCEAEGVRYDGTAFLDEPLGDRVVIDGTTGDPIAHRGS